MSAAIYFWRRTDVEGLERLELAIEPQGVRATSTVICLEAGGFRLDHRWQLDAAWRTQFATIERWNSQGHGILRLERAGTGWRVDGKARPDLERTEEPDLSVTPLLSHPIDLDGAVPLEIMVDNMRFAHTQAQNAAREIARIEQETGQMADLLLYKTMMSFRVMAQRCAEGAAPYLHPRLAAAASLGPPDDGRVTPEEAMAMILDEIDGHSRGLPRDDRNGHSG